MDYMMDLRPYITPNPYTIEPVSDLTVSGMCLWQILPKSLYKLYHKY